MTVRLFVALAVAMAALGGCTSTGPEPAAPAASSGGSNAAESTLRTGSAVDEIACEFAVAKATNNGETTILSSEMSEANTEVIIGVGGQKARWKCLVKDGKVAEVMSLTNEGAL
jgi:hypothetical protein